MLSIYKGNNRNAGGTSNTLPRLAVLFCDAALITSQATLLIPSRASTIDEVIDRSAAKMSPNRDGVLEQVASYPSWQ